MADRYVIPEAGEWVRVTRESDCPTFQLSGQTYQGAQLGEVGRVLHVMGPSGEGAIVFLELPSGRRRVVSLPEGELEFWTPPPEAKVGQFRAKPSKPADMEDPARIGYYMRNMPGSKS